MKNLIHTAAVSALVCACFATIPALAQADETTRSDAVQSTDVLPPQIDTPTAESSNSAPSATPLIDDALTVPPTQRSAKGMELAQSDDALAQLDIWIAQTDVDNPLNLKLKDMLMAMPVSIAGNRLVELAKKTDSPSIQADWSRWLSQYPEAHASVLRAWMKRLQPSSSHFLSLLRTYSELNLDDAIDVWAQLVRNFPFAQLGETAAFGLANPYCENALAEQISLTWNQIKSSNPQAPSADVPEILRLIRATSKCRPETGMPAIAKSCENRRKAHANTNDSNSFNGYDEDLTADLSEVIDQLLNAGISRRIAAIDFSAGWASKQPQIAKIFDSAKNSTEKAHALRALQEGCDENQPARVLDALQKGDETLRAEAAAIIADFPQDDFPADVVAAAFQKEIWTDTQLSLYAALTRTMADDKVDWMHAIYVDPNRAEPIRTTAMQDLIRDDATNITLSDLASLLDTDAPLELIASTVEHLYATQPDTRPQLREWIQAQQPFNRRTLTTFARFVHIDANQKDASAIELMRTICSKAIEQENILQPCLHYMTDNAQTDEDRDLAEKLQQRMIQYEAMTNLDLGL